MAYDVQVRQVEVQPVAAARGTVTSESVPGRLLELLDHVHAFLSRGAVASRGEDGRLGRNVFLYRGAPDRDLLASAEGMPVEVGVLVATPFADAGAVVCSETPAGLAATTVHVGPYEQIPQAHEAVRRWCRDHGHPISGLSWEVYDHWSDEPEDRRTAVYYLLVQ